jgi:hypothetical protein
VIEIFMIGASSSLRMSMMTWSALACRERIARDGGAGGHGFLASGGGTRKFLSLIVPGQAAVFPDVEMKARHRWAHAAGD